MQAKPSQAFETHGASVRASLRPIGPAIPGGPDPSPGVRTLREATRRVPYVAGYAIGFWRKANPYAKLGVISISPRRL